MAEKDKDRKPFNFKEFTKTAGFSSKTIAYLTEQNIDDETVLERLDPSRISVLNISEGDQVRLQLACEKRFNRTIAAASDSSLGAIGGCIKQEPGVISSAGDQAVGSPNTAAGNPVAITGQERPTTTSLARDSELNALLREFLGSNQGLSSFKDLLTLSDIKNAVEKKGEKPLLIGDFLQSNINVSYIDLEEDVQLSGDTKLVVGKKRKPDITDYTPELWSGASFRILDHLVSTGSTIQIIQDYARYSSMICDFLEIYVHKGVFCLDFEHRHRVAKEGRRWDDISGHDERGFLKFAVKSKDSHSPSLSQKSKRSKGVFSKKEQKS